VGESLQKILAPLVRFELLEWNPLEAECRDFLEMGWVEHLSEYGLAEGADALDDGDPDSNLVDNLVEDAVLPKLSGMCEKVWDPSSVRETAGLLLVVRQLLADFEHTVNPAREPTRVLFTAIVTRLREACTEWSSRPAVPQGTLSVTVTPFSSFLLLLIRCTFVLCNSFHVPPCCDSLW
jgi:hypothetical protein